MPERRKEVHNKQSKVDSKIIIIIIQISNIVNIKSLDYDKRMTDTVTAQKEAGHKKNKHVHS